MRDRYEQYSLGVHSRDAEACQTHLRPDACTSVPFFHSSKQCQLRELKKLLMLHLDNNRTNHIQNAHLMAQYGTCIPSCRSTEEQKLKKQTVLSQTTTLCLGFSMGSSRGSCGLSTYESSTKIHAVVSICLIFSRKQPHPTQKSTNRMFSEKAGDASFALSMGSSSHTFGLSNREDGTKIGVKARICGIFSRK